MSYRKNYVPYRENYVPCRKNYVPCRESENYLSVQQLRCSERRSPCCTCHFSYTASLGSVSSCCCRQKKSGCLTTEQPPCVWVNKSLHCNFGDAREVTANDFKVGVNGVESPCVNFCVLGDVSSAQIGAVFYSISLQLLSARSNDEFLHA